MHHDPRIQTPISIDFTSTSQLDPHIAPRSGDTSSGTPQLTIPSGTTVRMRDSAGTSMTLNLDIHPVHGTPLLSGQAITARGDVLEVHPCSCNDPIASRHNLPMTPSPELSRGGSLFPEHNEHYPSPSSLSHIRQTPRPARIRTPLVLAQTSLPSSHDTELLQELEIPTATPGPSANLKSPITPTPASVRRTSQTSSTGATYHTTQESLEVSSATRTAPSSHPPSQRDDSDVPPQLDSIPTVSTFDPDLEMPTISSVSSVSVTFSEPSAIGPLPSLPGYSSDSASEGSPCTVLAFSPLVTGVQHGMPREANVNRPPSRGAALHNTGTPDLGPATKVATDRASDRDSVKPSEKKTTSTSTSDLYADPVANRIPMPATRIESGGNPSLRCDLTAQPEPGPILTVCIQVHFWLSSISFLILGNRTSIIQEGATAQGQDQRNMDSQSGTRPCSTQARP